MADKRNIVLITLDSVRADHCSFMGYHRKTTPTMDKMAKKGLYFSNAVSPSHTTLPSMKAIFTGKFLDQKETTLEGVRKRLLKEFKVQTTISEIFRNKGYSTIGFSLNAWTSSYFGFNKGFDYFEDSFLGNSILSRLYNSLFNKIDGSRLFSNLRNLKNLILRDEVFSSWEKYYEVIIKRLENIKEPFFLWVFLLDTHIPYFSPSNVRKWSSFVDMNLLNIYYTWKMERNDFIVDLHERARKVLINAYDDSILYSDLFINKLWNDLEKFDPIFVIHADHGEGFNEHGTYGHYHPYLYQENVHVPLIIYNAEIKKKVDKPFSLLNLYSILPKLAENYVEVEDITKDDFVVSKSFGRDKKTRISVRIGNWKFITGQKEVDELYNLKQDSEERKNVIFEHPDLAREMRKIAEKYVKSEEKRKIIHKTALKMGINK